MKIQISIAMAEGEQRVLTVNMPLIKKKSDLPHC